MHIESVDIQNFRKLAAIRVEIAKSTTLLVGANNSGKTSALAALRRFLMDSSSTLRMTDITISNWRLIDEVGDAWEQDDGQGQLTASVVNRWMPSLDLWLNVRDHEVHRVSALIPTLGWKGGLLGVRIALEAKNVESLYREYRKEKERSESVRRGPSSVDSNGSKPKTVLWPSTLTDFLTRRLNKHFEFKYYVLDSAKRSSEIDVNSLPQVLTGEEVGLNENPIRSLVKIDQISAQRGFNDSMGGSTDEDDVTRTDTSLLSKQLSAYYKTHLDPNDMPDEKDLNALDVISEAQSQFDQRLRGAFSEALSEMQSLGYPGISDPRIRVASKLNAEQSLAHDSAVSFLIDGDGENSDDLHLPEAHNGLGYQNLISMIFKLMSFRDKRMRVGKEEFREHQDDIAPIHLVLVEEPEAHLHVQVQQVFARKAYEVLCNNSDLKNNEDLSTQLVMSTHSSNVSHELSFAQLRYFRRLPAGFEKDVPTSSVVSLHEIFGDADETNKFVARYLRAHHADLFFADAVIMVEGTAERMILPNFIGTVPDLTVLNSAYITILEINGSHSHRLQGLIERLRIPTLVITDLDATFGKKSVPVAREANQKSGNPALKKWAQLGPDVDALLDVPFGNKVLKVDDPLFQIRFAYQTELQLSKDAGSETVTVYPSTFEDALALENPEFFASLEGTGLTAKFSTAFQEVEFGPDLAERLFEALEQGKKAQFMLDILGSDNFEQLRVPTYIFEGLMWLQERLMRQSTDASTSVKTARKSTAND